MVTDTEDHTELNRLTDELAAEGAVPSQEQLEATTAPSGACSARTFCGGWTASNSSSECTRMARRSPWSRARI